MKTISLGLLSFLMFITAAPAASVPWIGVLSSKNPVVIPEGKALTIYNLSFPNAGTYSMTISGTATGGIGSGDFSAAWSYSSSGAGGQQLTSPIHLGPGMTLSVTGAGSITVFGVAMDLGDFFASANPSVRGVSTDGSKVAMVVDSRQKQAMASVTGEQSTDLQNWTSANVEVAHSVSHPTLYKVTAAMDGAMKFLRAKLGA